MPESVSPIAAPGVAGSLGAFAVAYFIVFGAGIVYLLRLVSASPEGQVGPPGDDAPVRSAGTTPVASLTGSAE